MDSNEVLKLFEQYDAFLQGHFLLTSGLHSPHYFQCAKILQHPEPAERLGKSLAEKISGQPGSKSIDAVLSPALGGLIIGHELGRALGCRAIFAERQDGGMRLRRFSLKAGERVVVVEDVVTTGGSLLETAACAREAGAEVLATCCLVDRSTKAIPELTDLISLAKVDAVNYDPADCPLCKQGIPLVKPGSRKAGKGNS
jgi:orotate phosphoribosyltransferase